MMSSMKKVLCCQYKEEKDSTDNLTVNSLILPLSRMKSRTKCDINSTKELLKYQKGTASSSINLINKFSTNSIEIVKGQLSTEHGLFIMKENSQIILVGYGSNKNGQLGLPVRSMEKNVYDSLIKIRSPEMNNHTIIDIAVAESFSLVLVEDTFTHMKKLLRFGLEKGEMFQVINNQNALISSIKEEKFKYSLEKIVKIYADEKRVILQSNDNSLYIKGYLFNNDIYTSYKLLKQFDSEINSVAFGTNHCLVLLKDYSLYTFGNDELGEVGLEPSDPNEINKNEEMSQLYIVSIACGKRHSLILTKNGELYAFGNNSENQCSGNDKQVFQPLLINAGSIKLGVSIIGCGDNYSICKTNSGDIYAWGNCDYLFKNEHCSTTNLDFESNEPKQIMFLNMKNIQDIYPGKNQILFYLETLLNKK